MSDPTCFECNEPADHTHHVIPQVLGGTKVVPLCARCHGLVHGQRLSTSALTRQALRARKLMGYRAGEVPFGYRADRTGKLHKDPGEQATIEAVRQCRALRLSQRGTVDELERLGHVSRSGNPLGRSQVRRILAR